MEMRHDHIHDHFTSTKPKAPGLCLGDEGGSPEAPCFYTELVDETGDEGAPLFE